MIVWSGRGWVVAVRYWPLILVGLGVVFFFVRER